MSRTDAIFNSIGQRYLADPFTVIPESFNYITRRSCLSAAWSSVTKRAIKDQHFCCGLTCPSSFEDKGLGTCMLLCAPVGHAMLHVDAHHVTQDLSSEITSVYSYEGAKHSYEYRCTFHRMESI